MLDSSTHPNSPALWADVAAALRAVHAEISWKAGKDLQHLAKRQALGHLPTTASVESYNALIRTLAKGPGKVYRYRFRGADYFAVQGIVHTRAWLLIFDPLGLIETAFPPDDLDHYLDARGFQYLATIAEILSP